MKKFYSFAVAMLAAATMTAMPSVERVVSFDSMSGNTPTRITLAPTDSPRKAKAKVSPSGEWTDWKSAGTGTLTMDDGLELFLGIEGYTGDKAGVTVDVRTDKSNINVSQYRFNKVLGGVDLLVNYDSSTDLLRMPMQKTAINTELGELLVMDAATAFEEIWGNDPSHTKEEIDAMVEMYAPYNYMVADLGRFYIYLGYTIDGFGDLLALSDISFQLDGFADYVPVFDLESYIDGKGARKGKVTVADGVKEVRVGVFPGSVSQHMIDKVQKGGSDIISFAGGEFDLPAIDSNVAHTAVAITYHNGEAMEWAYKHFSIIDDETELWTSLGNGKVVTDMLEMVWDSEPHEVTAEIQQNIANPGLYRVVNLHKSTHPLVEPSQCLDHNQYLIIDATDPQSVIIKPHDLGIDQGGGQFILESQATIQLNAGKLPGQVKHLLGTLNDGVITFPAESMTMYCDNWSKFGGEDGKLYLTNLSGKTSVTLPSNSVNAIEADSNAPVRYYNLQGIEIAAPAAGQTVIRVQGTTVTKTIIR